MKRLSFSKSFLLGILIIPLNDIAGWNLEKYSNIKSNEVQFSNNGIEISVKKSASPIFYTFKQKFKIKSFQVSGIFKGLPHFESIDDQGKKGNDDYPLRVGLIVPGDKTLTGLRKFLAAEWVLNLYKQIPNQYGLDHVHFFNFTQNKNQLGSSRVHASSELITEDFVGWVKDKGPFEYKITLKQPLEAVGIWISIDGDDTKSDYEVQISHLEFEVE